MPEIHFVVRWPDDSVTACYSPSFVVREYFVVGRRYAIGEFLDRSREALGVASQRVRARHGFSCTRAAAQLASIEAKVRAFERERTDDADAPEPFEVTVEAFVPI